MAHYTSWRQIGVAVPLSGNTHSGVFTDAPPTVGNYWYGIHVIDNANPTVVVHEATPLAVTVASSVTPPPTAGAPIINFVSPNPAVADGLARPFTINGSNFASGATVTLRAALPFPNMVISSLTANQIVINPRFGTLQDTWTVEVISASGVSSGRFPFSVIAPTSPPPPPPPPPPTLGPTISFVSPNPAVADGLARPFTINGSNFASGATVTLRAARAALPFPNMVISSLTANQIVINPRFGTLQDTWTVEVISASGVSSGRFPFSVIAPTSTPPPPPPPPPTLGPTISFVSPNPAVANGLAQPFTINGSHFASGTTVTLRTLSGLVFPNRVISSLTATQIVINPRFGTIADTWTVEVISSSGVSSGRFTFTVRP